MTKKLILLLFITIVFCFIGCGGGGLEDPNPGPVTNTPTSNPTSSIIPSSSPTGDLPKVGFVQNGSSGIENWEGTWYAQIKLDRPTDKTVYVEYRIAGTATQYSDYKILSQGKLAIPPDQQVQSTWLQWVVYIDDVYESNETIEFTLVNPENATIGEYKKYIHVICDDDNPFPTH
jgi:hypothetical protein